MNTSLYIARRYLFSKKSTNVINVISGISVVGVAVATMALVVVLSVFNGFSDLIATLFTSFDPQLQVVPTSGKTMPIDDPALESVRALEEVEVATNCVEDQALAIYRGQQSMVIVKGVDDNFAELTQINNIIYGPGSFSLHAADLQYGIPGIRLAQYMGMSADFNGNLYVYAPHKAGQLDLLNPMDGFVVDSLLSTGVVFCVQQGKYDKNYILTSIAFAQTLFECDGRLSSLEIKLRPGTDIDAVRDKINEMGEGRFVAKDRYEQQAETFAIMKIEKLIAYIFLTFILVVACFNIIGSLSMLIIDKRRDTETLRCLGARDTLIKRIFIFEGWLISIIGAVLGVGLGLLLCLLQQRFGLVTLGDSSGSFIIDAYPVSVHYSDVAIIFFTVLLVGFLSVLYPVNYATKRTLKQ